MPQIFHPAANPFSKASVFGVLIVIAAVGGLAYVIARSPYVTQAGVVREQPVPFSHEHHVSGLGISCVYCHASVERGAFAGMPTSKTCMSCHSQIWTDSPMLAPVRESYRTGEPIPWVRVNNLPDFTYFDHSVHVNRGISCASCHGMVERMPLTWRDNPFQMRDCLDCHRDPSMWTRSPRMATTSPGAAVMPRTEASPRLEDYLVSLLDPRGGEPPVPVTHRLDARVLTDCYVCHR